MSDHVWKLLGKEGGLVHTQCRDCGLNYLRGERCGEDTRFWVTADGTVKKVLVKHHHASPTIPCQPQGASL